MDHNAFYVSLQIIKKEKNKQPIFSYVAENPFP